MSEQIRLFFTAPKQKAEEIYRLADAALEDEGWPLSLADDEENGAAEISLYADAGQEQQARRRFAALAGLAETALEREILPQIDWVKHSLAGLKPVRAGRFFVHGAHDRDKMQAGDIGIEIEANRAFGTGHHGTTAGCLIMLEKILARENPANILDIGTGSGILAIAAAKLSKAPVLASDNDPLAIEIAAENIILNHAGGAVKPLCAEGLKAAEISAAAPFGLIIANILAGPLINMAADMRQALHKDGSLILSGILASQRDAVLAAYAAQGLRHQETLPLGDWVTLHLRRQTAAA